ncbi:hypothetical protein Dimus_035247 [Dionaea muscipula]
MENKQLNFSAPLISARRYSSPQRSYIDDNKDNGSLYKGSMLSQQKLDASLGEIVKPGSVPFYWEKTPGKAKDGSQSHLQHPQSPSSTTAPKLPPGRTSDVMPWTSSGKKSVEPLEPVRSAKNKLSGEMKVLRPQPQNKLSGELKVLRPKNKLSGELKVLMPQNNKLLSGELIAPTLPNKFSGELDAFGRTKLSLLRVSSLSRWDGSSKVGIRRNINSDCEADDAAAYSDAVDTLSQSQLESFSISCSISGASGSECPGARLPGKFTTDHEQQARDFMMSRFLPAAKAMTLESPQYASRRQLVVVEKPSEVKPLVPRVKEPTPTQNEDSKIIPYRGHGLDTEESEDEDVNCDLPSSVLSVKACGFLPWFCSRKTKATLSSATKIGRLVKTTPRKSLARAPTKKVSKPNSGINASSELHHVEDKRNGKSRPMFYSGELQTRRTLSPYRSCIQGSISPCRNGSPQRLFLKGAGFLKRVDQPHDHGLKLHQHQQASCKKYEPSPHERSNRGRGHDRSPIDEKTLYVDTVTAVRTSQLNSNSSKTSWLVGNGGTRATSKSKPSLHGNGIGDRWDIMKARVTCRTPISEVVDGRPPSSDETAKSDTSSFGTSGKRTNLSGQLIVRADAQCNILTPPLPKSPSDSWLLRNLSSGSPRNSFSSLHLANKARLKKQNAVTMPTSGTAILFTCDPHCMR